MFNHSVIEESEPVLISANKPTSQSSTDYGGVAQYALDGNTDSNFFSSSCSCTGNENNPWWMVDLQQSYSIESVKVWNRGDCCPERLVPLQVSILNPKTQEWKVCGVIENVDSVLQMSCKRGIGSAVKLTLLKQEYLTICEVEVWGGEISSDAIVRGH